MEDFDASNGGGSVALNDLIPAAFARILIPLSAVATARRVPSLLNLKHGNI